MAGTEPNAIEQVTPEALVEARRIGPDRRERPALDDDRALARHEPRREPDDRWPERVRRHFVPVETALASKTAGARVATDARGGSPPFQDEGKRLTTRLEAALIVSDMVTLAAHRGWETVAVRGSPAFRRAAWLDASARGLEVTGYAPTRLDKALLAERASAFQIEYSRDENTTRARALQAAPARVTNEGLSVRAEAWRMGGQSGIVPRAERDNAGGPATRPDEAQRWRASAERFRSLERRQAVRDPALAAAYSQIAVLERALGVHFPDDERVRSTVLEAARARVAEHLERGRRFRRAEVRFAERADPVERGGGPATRRDERERTHLRERGRDR